MNAPRPTGREHGLTRYKHGPDQHDQPGKGCRCTQCREASAAYERHRTRKMAYGQWNHLPHAAGTRRRLQALIWAGWTWAELAARYGCTQKALRKKLACQRVSTHTAAAVAALFDELWNQAPPEGTPQERRVATLARQYARDRGYVPTWAWDWDDEDPGGPHYIDNPDAVPVPGCVRGHRRERGITEAAVELTQLREHPEAIAVRLGVTPETVERTLQRAGCAP